MRNRIADFFERSREMIRFKTDWSHPLNLVHAANTRCNADCEFCAWKYHEDHSDELSTEEILNLYSDARRLGFETALLRDAVAAVDLAPGDGDRALDEMRDAGVTMWRTVMR